MTKYNPIDKATFQISGRELEDFICVFNKEQSAMPLIVDCVGITNPTPNYFVKRNDSNFYVFEYLMEGKGTLMYNGVKYLLEQGDFWFFEPHAAVSYKSDRNNPMYKYFIVFYCDAFDTMVKELDISGEVLIKNFNVRSEMLQLFEIVKDCPYNDRIAYKVFPLLFQIAVKIAERKNAAEIDSHDNISSTAKSLRELLDSHITKFFSIETAANQLFRSRSTLSRDFIKAFGITPYQYLLNKRLEVACSLLLNTNYTVKEISKMLVFSDPYYFSNLFKFKMKCSPSDYRKPHK